VARPILPMTDQWRREFVTPRGPANQPPVGSPAADFTLPYAQVVDRGAELQVEYGRSLTLSALRGQPVILNLTRIVSDRFF
jgi:hypothetical protein